MSGIIAQKILVMDDGRAPGPGDKERYAGEIGRQHINHPAVAIAVSQRGFIAGRAVDQLHRHRRHRHEGLEIERLANQSNAPVRAPAAAPRSWR
ncbi:MAG: hypothetical protein ACK4GT_18155 [Pararhodobacter sp.]